MSDNESEEEEVPKGPVENAWAIKIPEFKKGEMKSHLLEESSFSVLFPKYREKYLKECWPLLVKTLTEYGIKTELDLIEGKMTVFTTRKTWDPYIILKARDIIVLLGRSVPIEQVIKVLKDDVTHEIIKIRNMVRNKDRFVKRRQRLIGANGTTLKALELLTSCYVLIQGGTVAAIGPHKGVQQHEDWSKFIPKFTPKNVPRKKPKVRKLKKPYTPFPPDPTERKIDKQMAEGKFFIEKSERKWSKKRKPTEEEKKESTDRQREKRAKAFIVPEEPKYKPNVPEVNSQVDIKSLKMKVKNSKKK
ncbi:KRR1 small subunit processome component homolog isoform X2 [Cherax quadricarinatus]|uniref:KRR1 small subunit processome component homolog isoform X2 n=1 Tax=Cherax quadricarinatus TaxID=27406 RepID=UPI00237852D1|nr:KRR1 small subunit processome component homolog isoform X2 [Cherax quadricarinatus]